MKKIALKNSNLKVSIDDNVYQDIKNDEELSEVEFLDNLGVHAGGYAWFQKAVNTKGRAKNNGKGHMAIYLHRWVATHYLAEPISGEKMVVQFIDGDRMNCCVANLKWATWTEVRKASKK